MIRAVLASAAALSLLAAAPAFSQARGATSDPSTLAAGTYALDKSHARLQASIVHLGFSNYIMRFDTFDGQVSWNPTAPGQSSVNFTADPNSVNTGLPNFDKEVGGTFLGGTAVTFRSTSVQPSSATAGKVTGDLTLNGVTKPVTFDVRFIGGGPHPFSGKPTLGLSATTVIKRSDFNIASRFPAGVLSDEVTLTFDGEFNKN